LPGEKRELFDGIVRRWELSYAMMSVALDDALSLRASGKLVCARQQVSTAAQLAERFAELMISSCTMLAHKARNVEDLPLVEPLNAEFFRGHIGLSAASWSGILHSVLRSDRSRFLNKLRILSGTLERLKREFHQAANAIYADSLAISGAWSTLDCSHYDFNTCLRETEVVLKSFLRALPSEDTGSLASLSEPTMIAEHRRMTAGFSSFSDAAPAP
jgi:hypothetical protein